MGDILVPRVDIEGVEAGAGYEQCLEALRRHSYSRLLVMEGTPDHDLGYLAAKDLTRLKPEERKGWTARKGARQALRVPASMPLARLLARMRRSGVHFAVVKDEYGGTEGIATLDRDANGNGDNTGTGDETGSVPVSPGRATPAERGAVETATQSVSPTLPLVAHVGRPASYRLLAERMGATDWFGESGPFGPTLSRVRELASTPRDLTEMLGFDPLVLLKKLFSHEERD